MEHGGRDNGQTVRSVKVIKNDPDLLTVYRHMLGTVRAIEKALNLKPKCACQQKNKSCANM